MINSRISIFNGNKLFSSSVFFFIIAFFLLLWQLGTNDLWGSEDRWAAIAREMWLNRDFLHPTINGTVYFDKPLLTYWMILISAPLCGGINEFAVRLPSAVSALLALLVVYDLAKRLYDEKTAVYSRWLLLGCTGFLFWSRTAAAELPNLLAVLLAADWFICRKNKLNFTTYLVFFLICFIGAWAKGLPAIILPPFIVASYILLEKSFATHWKAFWKHGGWLAFAITGVIYLLPFIIAASTSLPDGCRPASSGWSGLELVWRENILRAVKPFDHDDEAFYAYLIHLPRLLMPWTIVFVAAIIDFIKRRKNTGTNQRWIWLTSLLILIIFSSSKSRRWYYLLPIIPFCAIATARYLADDEALLKKHILQIYRWFFKIAGWLLIPCSATAVIILTRMNKIAWSEIPFALPSAAVIFSITAVYFSRKQNFSENKLITMCVISCGLILSICLPAMTCFRTEKKFLLKLKADYPALSAKNIYIFPKCAGKIAFYLNKPDSITVLSTPEEVKKLFSDNNIKGIFICQDRPRHHKTLTFIPWQQATAAEPRHSFENRRSTKLLVWELPLPIASR